MDSSNNRIDVACIANYPSNAALRYLRKNLGDPVDGLYFSPMFYNFLDVRGAVISINSSHTDLANLTGIKNARVQFMAALNSIVDQGLKTVVLAASLKRFLGKNGDERIDLSGVANKNGKTISEWCPNVIFTNGDCGTADIFNQEIGNLLELAGVSKGYGRVGVVGAGILGTQAIKHLIGLGIDESQIFVVSAYSNDLREAIKGHEDVTIAASLEAMTNSLDAIICCTHSNSITKAQLYYVDCKFVLDVAVPPGFTEEEYVKCKDVYRQDGGNAYSENLFYQFDPSGIDLAADKEMYGCFAEGTALSQYIYKNGYMFQGQNLKNLNWFELSDLNLRIASSLFEQFGFSRHPHPLCFGIPV
ncbi:MAG: hypothetical protein WCO55_04215 [Candidatus Falkowbacteria bacterium]